MPNLYITKLGGSVITEKEKNTPQAKMAEIKRCAKEIAEALDTEAFRLVIVHGAGPFGHKFVAEAGIDKGVKGAKQLEAFLRTHESVAELNAIVVKELRAAGVPAIPVQPSACIIQENKKIVSFYLGVVKRLLEIGAVPVLYGDMVPDRALGASVCSGDAMVPAMARGMGAQRVFLGSNVEGVYDRDPSEKGAKIIDRIGDDNFDEVIEKVGGSKAVDVTEGMRGKLMRLKERPSNAEYVVFDLRKPGLLKELLRGKEGVGTTIKLSSVAAGPGVASGTPQYGSSAVA